MVKEDWSALSVLIRSVPSIEPITNGCAINTCRGNACKGPLGGPANTTCVTRC